mgnify:CR=1 FL=1
MDVHKVSVTIILPCYLFMICKNCCELENFRSCNRNITDPSLASILSFTTASRIILVLDKERVNLHILQMNGS